MSGIYNVSVITNGVTLEISDGDTFALLEEAGLSMAPVARVTERGAQQHGNTDVGFWLEPRNVDLVICIFNTDIATVWTSRNQLISALAPYNIPALELVLSDDSVRRLDCHLVGTMELGSQNRKGLAQNVGFTLRANDPSFYDPTAVTENYGLGGGGSAFVVPMVVPFTVGASTIYVNQSIVYEGTWYSHPIIRVVGPITNFVITNQTTDEKLDFTGVTIAGGDYYEIDTRYGRKSVVDSTGANKIGDLTADSDLATFHLEPDGAIAPDGRNAFLVEGTSATATTNVIITYYLRYLGI